MKTVLFALLLIPFASFAQLGVEDIKSIDAYALDMCTCVNALMEELHPKTIDVVLMMAELGEDAALKEIEKMVVDMSNEEVNEFVASFETMDEPAFLQRIENCDGSEFLIENLRTQMDNAKGEAFEYLMYVLDRELKCEVMKSLYDMGAEVDE